MFGDTPAGLHAADARHVDIEQDCLELAVAQDENCFFARRCFFRAEPSCLEGISQAPAQRAVIFDDQYRPQCCHVSCSAVVGIAMTKAVPACTSLSIEIFPPCASMAFFATDKPRPVPGARCSTDGLR
jgi:hypothetical protein